MDVPLRDAIAKGALAGSAHSDSGSAARRTRREDRHARSDSCVRAQTKSGGRRSHQNLRLGNRIRKGGGMTLSQEQLNAACDEANKQGLRTLVHAYKDAVRAADARRLHARSSTAPWRPMTI